MECLHKGKINRGYQGGYDLAWCDDCGVITWCSDGLISNEEARRSDRHKWCERRVTAFGCTREQRGEKLCLHWCGHSYCPVSIDSKGAADAPEALSKDAQRYRFLRGLPDGALYQSAVNEYLDEAIDAAIKKAAD